MKAGPASALVIATGLAASCGGGPTSPVPSVPAILIEVQAGITGSNGYPGQSFQLEGTDRVQQLRFNWYRTTGAPAAAGTLHLMTQEFLGFPGQLGPPAFGYLAHSERIEANEFVFPRLVTLSPDVTYWVYSDTQQDYSFGFLTSTYPRGAMYHSSHGSQPFRRTDSRDVNFRLQGVRLPR